MSLLLAWTAGAAIRLYSLDSRMDVFLGHRSTVVMSGGRFGVRVLR